MSLKITRREFVVENMLNCVRFCSRSGAFTSGFAARVCCVLLFLPSLKAKIVKVRPERITALRLVVNLRSTNKSN
jgi:hypothetical protein